jgi:hypothetical protein
LAEWGQTDWHEWQFEGSSPFTLDSLVVATHYANSTGVLGAVVLPATSTRYTRPGAVVAIGLAALWAALLWLRDSWFTSVALARAQHLLDLAVPGLAAVILMAPWVSPYRVVLSVGTIVLFASLLLLLPPLAVGIGQAVGARRA